MAEIDRFADIYTPEKDRFANVGLLAPPKPEVDRFADIGKLPTPQDVDVAPKPFDLSAQFPQPFDPSEPPDLTAPPRKPGGLERAAKGFVSSLEKVPKAIMTKSRAFGETDTLLETMQAVKEFREFAGREPTSKEFIDLLTVGKHRVLKRAEKTFPAQVGGGIAGGAGQLVGFVTKLAATRKLFGGSPEFLNWELQAELSGQAPGIGAAEFLILNAVTKTGKAIFRQLLKKYPKFNRGWQTWAKGKSVKEVRTARQEVDEALKIYKKTGNRTAWDAARVKYAGIKPEGVERIRARAAPPEVKDFGKYPLAAVKQPTEPMPKPTVAPLRAKVTPERVKVPEKPVRAVTAGKQPWETSDLATAPNIPIGSTEAKKQADGKWKLFFRGTLNEVFQGEKFNSAAEAKQFFKVQQLKAQESQPPAVTEGEFIDAKTISKVGNMFTKKLNLKGEIKWKLGGVSEDSYANWKKVGEDKYEITIHPESGAIARSQIAMKDTMAHELTHLMRNEQGKPKQITYHTSDFYRDWDKVRELLGLEITPILELAKRTKAPPAPAVTEGKVYKGKAYRSPTGFKVDGTAADVVRYEQEELGNNLGVSKEQLKELEKHPSSDIVWVTRTKAEAARYGGPEEIDVTGGKIIADIGPDGVLVLKARPAPAVAEGKPKGGTIADRKARQAKLKKVKPEIPLASQAQKAKAHILAKEKGFISTKGKPKPQYRRLAKAMTGQTSIAKMTKEQASDFISAIKKLPEPRMVRGKLVPPPIPITTRIVKRGQFQKVFKEPTPITLITDPSFYAHKLGVKSLVEPLETAKQDFDFEYRNAAHELDKQGALIDKIGKTTFKEKLASKIKNVPTKAREEIGRLLNVHETVPKNISPEQARIFNYFRGLTRTILTRQNEARTKLGWPTIPSRKAYMRHIATDISKEMLSGKYPFPEGVKFWSGTNTGEKVFNPMEFRRKLEADVFDLFTKDPVRASKAMMYTALKEIHLNQPLKFYKQQLNALGKDLPEYKNLSARERSELDKTMALPASTRRWLTEYVNITILGRQSKVDELVNNTITKSGLKGVFNKILAPFGRTVGRKPVTDFFRRGGRVQMAGVLGPRPRIILRNKFQLTQNLALYTNKANIRAFGPNNAELNALLEQSKFLRDYTGLEDLPIDLAKKIEQLWHAAYQWSAKSNAKQGMEVAYWDTKELIDNPKYKQHGWKNEHLLREMEFGASATQFHYTAIGMPHIFRHRTLLPLTRLTSWWMNYFAKFHREAIHRVFTGRPSWAGEEGPTLPWSRRLGWLRYIVIGGTILNTMGYTRSFLFGAAPTGWPPAMQFAWNAYLYTVSKDDKQKENAKRRMWGAAKTFIPGYIAYKDFEAVWSGKKDLPSLFFYKKIKKEK